MKITEFPSETIQKLSINHQNIENENYNAETKPFTCTNIIEYTNNSLEVSPIENMETIIHSRQSESRINETTETDFNSTLLDDGTLFSSHTVNTLIDLEDNNQNNNTTTNTTENTIIYQNHQQRQPVNSTELTQNSNPLNTTLPPFPNINTPLPRLHRQNSVHVNTQPIILNKSTQPTQGANQNKQITPQQLVNIVRQIKIHSEVYNEVHSYLNQYKHLRKLTNRRFGTAQPLRINTYVLIVNKTTQIGVSKKIKPQKIGP